MEQVSKQTVNQAKNGQVVVDSINTHGKEVVEPLVQILSGSSELTPSVIRVLLGALSGHLEYQNEALMKAEESLTSESADDVRARTGRDDEVSAMKSDIAKTKSMISNAFGENAVREYGLLGEYPRSAKPLAKYVRNTIALLRSSPRELEDNILGSVKTERIAGVLEEGLAKLEAVNSTMGRENRETQLAFEKRESQVEQWTQSYRGVAKVTEGLYILAGFPELADRVRETARKSTGKEAPEEVEESTPDQTNTQK